MKNELKWGLIFSSMQIAWILMEKQLGLYGENIANHIYVTGWVVIPSVIIYLLALREKKRNYFYGQMTYKQGFMSGLWMTMVITILAPLVQYLTSEIIAPEYFPNMIKYALKEGMIKTRALAEAEFNLKSYIIQVLWFTPMMGIFTTSVLMFFLRSSTKNKNI